MTQTCEMGRDGKGKEGASIIFFKLWQVHDFVRSLRAPFLCVYPYMNQTCEMGRDGKGKEGAMVSFF